MLAASLAGLLLKSQVGWLSPDLVTHEEPFWNDGSSLLRTSPG